MASAQELRRSVKGLSEAGFRERFGTGEACREALLGMRWREGLTCPACGGRGFCALKTPQVFPRNPCKKQISLAAGTNGVPGHQAAARHLVRGHLPPGPGQERDQLGRA